MTNLPSLYGISTALAELIADDDTPWEQAQEKLDVLLPALQHKVSALVHVIEYHADLARAIKDREKRIAEARKALEAKTARLEQYLLQGMLRAEVHEIADETTGVRVRVRQNPPSVQVDDEAAIPPEYMVQPEPPAPHPDKKAIAAAIKRGEEVPGCSLKSTSRLEIK